MLLLVAAIVADAAGADSLSFYVLLAAVVVTAHAALAAYGHLVELPGAAPTLAAARAQAALTGLALVLVVVAAAVRAPVVGAAPVPAVGLSALVASFVLLLVQDAVRLAKTS